MCKCVCVLHQTYGAQQLMIDIKLINVRIKSNGYNIVGLPIN